MRKRVIVIRNPKAGQRQARFLARVLTHLAGLGVLSEVWETKHPGHATELAKRASSLSPKPDALVVAGGDGTLSEAIDGLDGDTLPIGIIPTGTANVMARELGLVGFWPRSPKRIANAIAGGQAQPLYPARATTSTGTRALSLMLGIGFDAEVVRAVRPALKGLVGRAAFVVAGFEVLFGKKPKSFEVIAGEKVAVGEWLLATNGRLYAGSFKLSPTSDLSTRGFTLLILRQRGRASILWHLMLLACGKLDSAAGVTRIESESFRVENAPNLAVEVDGDDAGNLPLDVSVSPAPVLVIRPSY